MIYIMIINLFLVWIGFVSVIYIKSSEVNSLPPDCSSSKPVKIWCNVNLLLIWFCQVVGYSNVKQAEIDICGFI